jgi:hypothetical protein
VGGKLDGRKKEFLNPRGFVVINITFLPSSLQCMDISKIVPDFTIIKVNLFPHIL